MALRILSRKNLTPTISGAVGSGHFRGLQTFSLPDLPYDYGALEPVINAEIMQLHHQKHHQAYITNYNKALEQLHEAINKGHTSTVVKLQSAIKFNGGGFPLFLNVFSFSDFDMSLLSRLYDASNQIESLNWEIVRHSLSRLRYISSLNLLTDPFLLKVTLIIRFSGIIWPQFM